MPGPVSDSYDPEFGTGSNAVDVHNAVSGMRNRFTDAIGTDALKNIVEVVHSEDGEASKLFALTERECRIIRFALDRAMESL